MTRNGMKIGLKSSMMNLHASVLPVYTVLCGLHKAAFAVMTAYAVLLKQHMQNS